MKHRLIRSLAAVVSASVIGGTAAADLIGVKPGHPLIVFDNQGVLTYDASTGTFLVEASPVAIQFAPNEVPRLITPTGNPPAESVRLEIIVGPDGALIGGVAGDDLRVVGQIDADGDGTIDYDGVLLRGEVDAFGFQNTTSLRGPAAARNRRSLSAGSTDQYDFRFTATGGMLAGLYGDIGIVLTSEMSNFSGSFTVDFGGEAKGDVGSLPVVILTGACCLPDGTCAVLTADDCAAAGGIYLGDDVQCGGPLGTPASYRLRNHPDAQLAPPGYGLRLTELFNVTPGTDQFSFDFDAPESEVYLDFDGRNVHIHGVAIGGRDAGAAYDPAWTSLLAIDFTYHLVMPVPGDDDLWVTTPSLSNSGTVTWLATGEVFDVLDKINSEGFTFRFGNEDDDAGHRGYDGLSGWGWLVIGPAPYVMGSDWLFTAVPVCEPDCTGIIGDYVWLDENRDGCQDDTEPGVPGVDVILSLKFPDGTTQFVASTQTSDSGAYLFEGLCAGTYLVEFDASGLPVALEETQPNACGDDDERDSDCVDGVVCVTLAAPDSVDLSVDCGLIVPGPGPSHDCCENGKPRVLVFEYTGEDCTATSHGQDPGKVSCAGDPAFAPVVHIRGTNKENPNAGDAKVWFDGDVDLGGTFSLDATAAGDDHFPSETFIHIFDLNGGLLQTVKFHTSCSQPLFVGNQFGANLLVDCVGEDEPIPGDCCENGKPRVLVFEYTGEDCTATSHGQDPGKVSCAGDPAFAPMVHIRGTNKENPGAGDAKVWFDGLVDLGETFSLDATAAGDDHFPSETFIHIFDLNGGLLQTVKFHTSCSQPLYVGNQFGASLLVDCVGENEPIEGDCCENGKPRVLVFEYTGEDCTATSHGQDPGKVSCAGDPAFAPMVHIRGTNKENPNAGDAKVWFDGDVDLGGTFSLDATAAGDDHFPSETFIHIFDLNGGLLQTVKFHTSCSQPLFVGNQFGASLLVDCVGEDEPIVGGSDDCCADGKPRALVFQYTGQDCAATVHGQDPSKVTCDGDPGFVPLVRIRVSNRANAADGGANVFFDDTVLLGTTFTADASANDFSSETFIHVFDLNGDLLQFIRFHTSCSQPLFVGYQFGSALIVDCIGQNEPVDGSFCNGPKIRVLTVQYTGDDCTATQHSQDPDKVSCDGDPGFETWVRIRASNRQDPNDGGAKVWFDGITLLSGHADFDAGNAGDTRLASETWVHVFDLQGVLLQTVRFHTSCSQPLFEGDQFGSIRMTDYVPE